MIRAAQCRIRQRRRVHEGSLMRIIHRVLIGVPKYKFDQKIQSKISTKRLTKTS